MTAAQLVRDAGDIRLHVARRELRQYLPDKLLNQLAITRLHVPECVSDNPKRLKLGIHGGQVTSVRRFRARIGQCRRGKYQMHGG